MEYITHSPAETEELAAAWGGPCGPAQWWRISAAWAWARPPLPGGLPRGWAAGAGSPVLPLPLSTSMMAPLPCSTSTCTACRRDALFDIGWEDYLDRGGVCAVEWSENVRDALPPDASPSPLPAVRKMTLADHHH